MKKTVKIVLCLTLVLSMLACLAGCGPQRVDDPNNVLLVSVVYDANGNPNVNVVGTGVYDPNAVTPAPTAPQSNVTPAPTQAPAGDATTAPSGDATTAPSGGETPSEAPQGNTSGVPSTPEEIVNLFKTAYDKASTSAKSVTKTYSNASNQPAICEAGKLSSVANTLMGMFLKAEELNEVSTDLSVLPPAGITVCNLKADMVKTATCEDKGDYYEVTIQLTPTQDSPDINPPAGGGKAGTIVSVVESSTVENAAKGFVEFTGLENKYFDTKIVANIEKASGNLTYLYTICPSIMAFAEAKALKVLSVQNAAIGLTYEEKWTVQW